MEDNTRRGRRCLDLALPPDFVGQGIYTRPEWKSDEFKEVVVQRRFTGQRVSVSTDALGDFEDISEVVIHNNHSEKLVAISFVGDAHHDDDYMLRNEFTSQFVSDAAESSAASDGFLTLALKKFRRSPSSLALTALETAVFALFAFRAMGC
jgi:hypothetical protein